MKILHEGKAIIVGLEEVNLDDFPSLRVIGCNMTSCEHLPLEEMKKRGIKLISLKDFPNFLRKTIFSTAEHTIGLIIALLRNYKITLNAPYKEREEYKGHTLFGKTITLFGGNGRIGSQVSDRLKAFGMDVWRVNKNEIPQFVLSADIISLHIPLEGNVGFFTKEMFSKMKPTSLLINTSRDRIIEKGALIWALSNHIISGAAIDFTEDTELLEYAKTHHNLILTPHLGGATYEDLERTANFIEKQVGLYLDTIKNN